MKVPVYAYKCPTCDFRIEIRQKITDEKHPVCPKCKGAHPPMMVRVPANSSFQLKGGGWYAQNYQG